VFASSPFTPLVPIQVFELSDPVGTDSSNLVLAGGPTAANGDTAVSEDGMSASSKIFPNNSTVTIGSALVAVIISLLFHCVAFGGRVKRAASYRFSVWSQIEAEVVGNSWTGVFSFLKALRAFQ